MSSRQVKSFIINMAASCQNWLPANNSLFYTPRNTRGAQNIATRKNVIKTISKHIDAIAITIGPGLIGSLLVGVETAKTMAMLTGVPIIPVNHVLAHMYANFIDKNNIIFPAISLVVSGGHTELYLMKSPNKLTWLGGTLDDAAGECFDKTARLLGFGQRRRRCDCQSR